MLITKSTIIYALLDPRDMAIRYIGKTIQSPSARLKNHLRRRLYTHKGCWIHQLKERGLEPIWQTLEVIPAGEEWEARECWWIAHGRNEGWPLTNIGDGGEGPRGFKHSAEARKKISDARKGTPLSEETRRKLSEINRGRKHSEEARRKIGKASKGNQYARGYRHTEDAKYRISEAMQGNKHPSAKLTEEQVQEIRRRQATNEITQVALACEYKITPQAIWRIIHRITWTHI